MQRLQSTSFKMSCICSSDRNPDAPNSSKFACIQVFACIRTHPLAKAKLFRFPISWTQGHVPACKSFFDSYSFGFFPCIGNTIDQTCQNFSRFVVDHLQTQYSKTSINMDRQTSAFKKIPNILISGFRTCIEY